MGKLSGRVAVLVLAVLALLMGGIVAVLSLNGREAALAGDDTVRAVVDGLGEPRPEGPRDIGTALAVSFRAISGDPPRVPTSGRAPLSADELGRAMARLSRAAERHYDDRSREFAAELAAGLANGLATPPATYGGSAAQLLRLAFNEALGIVLDDEAHDACRRAFLDELGP